MSIKRLLVGFCICLAVQSALKAQPLPTVAGGQVIRHADMPSKWVSARHVDVWLPPDYDGRKSFPVLYMHDGQMLFDSTHTWNRQEWEVDETLMGLSALGFPSVIVVGIWNNGETRHLDYFPEKPFGMLPQETRDSLYQSERSNGQSVFKGEIRSDAYLRFLVKELKPFIDSAYRTRKDRMHTFIAGSSMGGLISMYAFCEYPKVFGGAACLSTHWPGVFQLENNPIPDAFVRYLKEKLPKPGKGRIYFDYGTTTLDALYPPLQKKADAVLRLKGYGGDQWLTLAFPGEPHAETAWKKRLHIPLQFLLRNSE